MKHSIFRRSLPLLVGVSLLAMNLNLAQADLTDPNGYITGVGTSSYAVMNTSGASATVVATYYNPGGGIATVQNLPAIPTLGRANVDVASVPGLPTNWVGSVVLSADQDIIAAAVTAYTGRNPVPDASISPSGTEAGVYEAFNAGSTKLFAPSLFRIPAADVSPARQVSRFTIQNTVGSTANYTITYRSRTGELLGTWTGTLNAYGSRTFNTQINSDLPAGVPGKTAFSAEIDSDQPLAGVSETSTSIGTGGILNNWVGDHALLTPVAAANVLFSPAAFRVCPNTPAAQANCANYANINTYYTSFIQYSSFQLQNTTNQVANVTADFINRATGAISYTLNFTIAPNSGYGINLFNGGNLTLTHPLFPALGSRFAGSVRFTSDQPLVGVGNLDFPANAYTYGSYNLIGASDATNTVLVPTFNRVCPNNDATCNTTNLGNYTRVSAVQVMNVGVLTVTLNNFELIDANGTVVLTLTNANGNPLTLAPGQALGLNLFNGGDFNPSQFVPIIGNNFQGSLRVNAPAGAKLKAIVEWRDGNRSMDQFNAFNR